MSPRTVISDPPAKLADYEARLIDRIRENGWQTTSVVPAEGEHDLSFSYTIGFWLTLSQPEIILFDFPPQLAHDVFGQIFRKAREGFAIQIGQAIDGILSGELVYFFRVTGERSVEYLRSSQWFYRRDDFPVVQLVWADKAGRFPWEQDFDPALASSQPDLSPRGWQWEISQAR